LIIASKKKKYFIETAEDREVQRLKAPMFSATSIALYLDISVSGLARSVI
jgi:hypothetical protein